MWTKPEQFELLVSFAATLADDLFRAGQLISAAIDDEPPVPIRRVRDLDRLLDRLAVVQPRGQIAAPIHRGGDVAAPRNRKNLLTFAPDGAHGVSAFVDGEKTATA
jgi:uncharacterized protein (DUF58 family)